MNLYLAIILFSLLGAWLLGVISKLLNAKAMRPQIPLEFKDTFDNNTYAKSQEYARASMRFSVVVDTFNTMLTICFLLFGGFNMLDLLVRSFGFGTLTTGLAYIGALGLVSGAAGLPFEAYHTFVLENRFGFNTTTLRTFITDRVTGFLLSTIIGGVVIGAILLFFQKAGPHAWMICWAFSVAVTLGLTYVAPTLILPLFNKFTPLKTANCVAH